MLIRDSQDLRKWRRFACNSPKHVNFARSFGDKSVWAEKKIGKTDFRDAMSEQGVSKVSCTYVYITFKRETQGSVSHRIGRNADNDFCVAFRSESKVERTT